MKSSSITSNSVSNVLFDAPKLNATKSLTFRDRMALWGTLTKTNAPIVEQPFQLPSIFPVDIDRQGRVVIPTDLRHLMDISIGNELIWIKRDTGIWLEKANQTK